MSKQPQPSPLQPSDGQIVAAVLAGDRDQFALMVDRYQGALLRAAQSRLGRADWAEDVVQEAFLCAVKFLHTYDSRHSFRTWLWTILLNQCHRHFQRRQRQVDTVAWGADVDQGEAAPASTDTPPVAAAMAREQSQRLEQQLQQLPTVQADALRLRFFGGLKYQEIATTMSCSLSTAKNRVRWGLTRISQRLADSSALAPAARQDSNGS